MPVHSPGLRKDKPQIRGVLFRGTVISNSDPQNAGRIKARVPEVHGDISDSALPWLNALSGFSPSIVWLYVPQEGDQVTVVFLDDNVYFGLYLPALYNQGTKSSDLSPTVYGFKDDLGNSFRIDRSSGEVVFDHSSGTSLTIAGDGKITVDAEEDVEIFSDGDVNVTGTKINLN